MRLCLVMMALALIALPAIALEEQPEVVEPPAVCPTPGPVPLLIEAETIEQVGALVRATGGILFLSGNRRVTASEAVWNVLQERGTLKHAVFTTCQEARPHYRIEAEEVTLLPNNKVHARRVSVYVGRYRVMVLPSIKMRVGGRAASTSVIPRPGYDRRDGFTLSQELRLVDADRTRTDLDVTLATRRGVQGALSTDYGLDGTLEWFPGRFLTYDSLRSHVMRLPRRPEGGPCDPESLRPKGIAHLRAFGELAISQRTYDITRTSLVVSRQPELGLRYIGSQINLTRQKLDPRIEIYPELSASWGRFKESPGPDSFEQRSSVTAVAAVNILPLGQSTAVQPVVSYRLSKYGSGDTYRLWAYAIDASHIFPNGSFVSARYIKRADAGATPFEFDDLDIRREFQGAFQARVKRHTLGMVLSYDADTHVFYNWEAVYAYSTDCITSWIRWDNRFRRVAFDISFVSF